MTVAKLTKRGQARATWLRLHLEGCPPQQAAIVEFTYRDAQDIAAVLRLAERAARRPRKDKP
jgi:hypothetical protein